MASPGSARNGRARIASCSDPDPPSEAGNEIWLIDDRDALLSIAYCAPERMAEGMWNLYLIAVHPDRQGQGRGGNLLAEVERALVDKGARLLLVETSGLPEFERTRAFYLKNGYVAEATVREFYKSGEDKIIFRKLLI